MTENKLENFITYLLVPFVLGGVFLTISWVLISLIISILFLGLEKILVLMSILIIMLIGFGFIWGIGFVLVLLMGAYRDRKAPNQSSTTKEEK